MLAYCRAVPSPGRVISRREIDKKFLLTKKLPTFNTGLKFTAQGYVHNTYLYGLEFHQRARYQHYIRH